MPSIKYTSRTAKNKHDKARQRAIDAIYKMGTITADDKDLVDAFTSHLAWMMFDYTQAELKRINISLAK